MFKQLKKLFAADPNDIINKIQMDSVAEVAGIAAPKQTQEQVNTASADASAVFVPIDVVAPDQSIPGKFNYHSATWKYLQHYFNDRIDLLHRKNENQTLSLERTQLIRGQIKEIRLLFTHTNQLAGVTSPPTKTSLNNMFTDKGPTYE